MRRFTLILLVVLVVGLLTAAVVQVVVKPGHDRIPRITPSPSPTATGP